MVTLSPLLLYLLLLSASISTTAASPKFREAPKFYNSPNCPSLTAPDHAAGKNKNTWLSFTEQCSQHAVHVAMTLDAAYLRGSMAAILSVLQHSSCPENTLFHFVAASSDSSLVRATVSSSFPYLNFHVYRFDEDYVSGLISASIRSALDCPLNYARSYLSTLLPACVDRVVYLDSDLVLVDDIAKLFATDLGPEAVIAAPEYCAANFTSYFTDTFWSSPSLSLAFSNRKACYFNTGVMVVDLERWRGGDYTARIEEWMEVQKRVRIYELGSLPPFLLVFGGGIVPVEHRWNQHGLGGDNFKGLCRDLHPGPVSLLHWSGKGKPWVRLDRNRPCPLDALWAPYDLLHTPYTLDS